MTILHPIYTDDDLQDMDKPTRQQLARTIHEVLLTDPDVRALIREKADAKLDELKKGNT
jgi:hypothetical protein